jgi:hypothetical protein
LPGFHRTAHDDCALDRRCADQTENPCGSGVCTDGHGVIECVCEEGYEGARCELCAPGYARNRSDVCFPQQSSHLRCNDDSCSGHGACDENADSVVCTCDAGYASASCGACAVGYVRTATNTCSPSRTCFEQACHGHGTCSDESGEITCQCDPGWSGARCWTCSMLGQEQDLCSQPPCRSNPVSSAGLLDFEDQQAFPMLDDNCSNGVPLATTALSMQGAGDGPSGWACSASTIYGLTTPHVFLEVDAETPGRLTFGGPVERVSFDYGARTPLGLAVFADGEMVRELSAQQREHGHLSLSFGRPVVSLEFRSVDARFNQIAVDNVALTAPACL